jgi:hypothetical protein
MILYNIREHLPILRKMWVDFRYDTNGTNDDEFRVWLNDRWQCKLTVDGEILKSIDIDDENYTLLLLKYSILLDTEYK